MAEVNGNKIHEETLDIEISRQVDLSTAKLSSDQKNTLKRKMLENLVQRSLLLQSAQKQGTSVADETVVGKVTEIKGRVGDFNKWLEEKKYTEESFSKLVKEDLIITKYITDEIVNEVKVTEPELTSFYENNKPSFDKPEQVKARHILVKASQEASKEELEKAKAKIEKVKELAQSKDFAELAKEHSEGPSGVRGGDLGYFTYNQMVPPFSEEAFKTEVGNVSDVVKTSFGYHIIKVEDKKAPQQAEFAEVKDAIREQILRTKSSKLVEAKLQELKDQADVVIYIN